MIQFRLIVCSFLVVSSAFAVQKSKQNPKPSQKTTIGVRVLKLKCGDLDLTCSLVDDETYAVTSLKEIENNPTGLAIAGLSTNVSVVGVETSLKIAVLKLGRKLFDVRSVSQTTAPIPGNQIKCVGIPTDSTVRTDIESTVSGISKKFGATFVNFRGEIDPSMVGGTLVTGTKGNVQRIGFVTGISSDSSPHSAVSAQDVMLFVAQVKRNVEMNLSGSNYIGRLGQSKRQSPIYAEKSPESLVYYKLDADEYLVVLDAKSENYWGVLLQNGKTGYVAKVDVTIHEYNIKKTAKSMGVLVRGKEPMSQALTEFAEEANRFVFPKRTNHL